MSRGRIWGLVPAAGVGRRMGGPVPKQYLSLDGRTVLDHSLERLLDHPRMQAVCVALSADDGWWPTCRAAQDPRVFRAAGGAERCHSVLNALRCLEQHAAPEDWVLVHDAVRPCVRRRDLDLLIARLESRPVGGILALPVTDTVKLGNESRLIVETLPRERLWRAFTPQMFRVGPLGAALQAVLDTGALVTDEASAMELAGYAPELVEGHADNIKITRPDDLALAAFFMSRQQV